MKLCLELNTIQENDIVIDNGQVVIDNWEEQVFYVDSIANRKEITFEGEPEELVHLTEVFFEDGSSVVIDQIVEEFDAVMETFGITFEEEEIVQEGYFEEQLQAA